MNEKGKRLQRQKQEDATFHKMLLWLAGIVVLEVITLALKKLYIDNALGLGVFLAIHKFFVVFRIVGAVLVVLGCLWIRFSRKQGKKSVLPLVCTGVVFWVWLASILSWGASQGFSLLCAAPVALAILCAIHFLYHNEFLFSGVLGAVGIAAVWVAKELYMNHPRMTWCGAAAVCVVMALAAVFANRLSKADGKLGKLRVFSAGAAYLPMYLTCAVVAVVMVAAVLLNAAVVGYYAIGVLAAWLFCLAVYYTVKLM